MKALTHTLALFILSILVFNNSMAQKASYTTNSGMTIGFGAGGAYQTSDIANSIGYGFDFVLGSHLYKKENAFLSVDWKFRFLAGENKAFDHRINLDSTYSNIRYSFFNYDLELGLTLNRLRERTGIVITGFAGAGITHGRTFTDLYDAGSNLYDFSSIDPNRDSKLVYKDLLEFSDGDFETSLVNKAALLPTAGIFIGYQFSPSFSLGIEFKTNFYLTEENSLTGIDLDNRVLTGLDRNSYIALGFKWNLRGGSSYSKAISTPPRDVTNNIPKTTQTENTIVPATSLRPSVNITDPSTDSYRTVSNTHTIKATVTNVSGRNNISFYQDGFPITFFSYNATTKIFTANVNLEDGENSFRIKATNQTASAEDLVNITLEKAPEGVRPAPEVGFTSPSETRTTSSSDRINITARVTNINSEEDIQLTLNGSTIPFEFNPRTGSVWTSVSLTTGDNNLLVRGTNESGSAEDQLTVIYNRPEQTALPSVRFVNPASQVEVTSNLFPLSAQTQNVSGRSDVTLNLNGASIGNFSFNANGGVSASLILSEGVNTIEITARNEAGLASDRTTITYNIPVTYNIPATRIPPPVINIITPANNQVSTYESSEELRASVLNVNTKDNITLTINGSNTRDFSFNNITKTLTTRVALRDGNNVMTIRAQNEAGSDFKDQVFLKEIRPCPLPVIRLINPAQGQSNTNQPVYTLQAQVNNLANINQLRLTVNGNTVPFSFNNSLVTSSIQLTIGLNTISLNARNECGEDNASARISYTPVVKSVPCNPPKVSIGVNEVDRADATHELRGSVSDVNNKADILLTVSGTATDEFRFVPETGELSATLNLAPGSHAIVVFVKNACGADSKSLTVDIEEPCIPPKVSIGMNEVDRAEATHELKGSVSDVIRRAGISLKVNGTVNDGFQFLPATGALSAAFSLTPGSHIIVVSVRNECGTDSKSVSVDIEEPCTPPTISFGVNEVDRADVSHVLSGSVSNVNNRAGISLTINGTANDGFRFVPQTGELSATFNFEPGSQTIVVTVSNECGVDSKSVTVDKEVPCTPPKVSIGVNEVARADASHVLSGSVSDVNSKEDISLTVNDIANNGFRFVSETGVLSATLNLTPGSHTIVVSVKNACGTDSKSVIIEIEEPCIPPVVSIGVNEVNRPDATHELSGSVSNVDNREGISLTVNGTSNDEFNFLPTTGELSATFKLIPGAHIIVVSVNNECGADSKSVTVEIEEPCNPPRVSIGVNEVDRADATHVLSGSVSDVNSRADISFTVNGTANDGFQYVPATGQLSATFNLTPGSHTILVAVKNACGTDSKSVIIEIEEPCIPPTVSISVNEVNRDGATHELSGSVSDVNSRADISLTVNGTANDGFQYVPATGQLSATFNLTPGSHTILVAVKNACGADSKSVTVIKEVPCNPPTVSLSVNEVNRDGATHELSGSVSDVESRSDISLTVNGTANDGFTFVPATGALSAAFNLTPGEHTIIFSVSNECGEDTETESITIEETVEEEDTEDEDEEEACGVRINPGNSAWQFCMETPSGTYTRENLTDANFSYSGPATSLYFMPIGDGGDVVVIGSPYAIRSGQYYLFTGNLDVSVSTSNPGSMGHWSVCVNADKEPESGNGNNRPTSPCEEEEEDSRGGGKKNR